MNTESENALVCMDILEKTVGTEGMIRFIKHMIDHSSNYTLDRREMFDDMTLEEVIEAVDRAIEANPQYYGRFA